MVNEHADSAAQEPQGVRRAPVRRSLATWAAAVLLLVAAMAASSVMAEDPYYDGFINIWLWWTFSCAGVYAAASIMVWFGVPWSGLATWAVTAVSLPYWLALGSAIIDKPDVAGEWFVIIGSGLGSIVFACLLTATPAARRFTRDFEERWTARPPAPRPAGGDPDSTPPPPRSRLPLRRASPPPTPRG